MVRPIDFTPAHLSFEEVAVHYSREVLMKFGNSSVLLVGNPQWIKGLQLRHHPNCLLIFIIIMTNTY